MGNAASACRKKGKQLERVFRKLRRSQMEKMAGLLGIPFTNPESLKEQRDAEEIEEQWREREAALKRKLAEMPPTGLDMYLHRTPFADVRQRLSPPITRQLNLAKFNPQFKLGEDTMRQDVSSDEAVNSSSVS